MIAIQYWSFLGLFLRNFVSFKVKRDNVISFCSYPGGNFKSVANEKTGQNFKWHFLQIVKKRVLSNNNNFSVFFPLQETK